MPALTLGSDPKVENMKIVCQVCGIEGYLQHITENYYRVRHYVKLDSKSKKPVFTYHKQSVDYIRTKIDPNTDPTGQVSIDPKVLKSGSVLQNKEGRSSSLVGRWLYEPKVAGSSPARPTCS